MLNTTFLGEKYPPIGVLRINYEGKEDLKVSIEEELRKWCKSYNLLMVRTNHAKEAGRNNQYNYQIRMRKQEEQTLLFAALKEVNPQFSIRMEYDTVSETFN